MSHVNPGHHPGQYLPYSPPMSNLANHSTQPMQYPQYPEGVDGRSPPPPPQQAPASAPPQQAPASAPPQQHLQYYASYPMQAPGDPNAPTRFALPPHPDGRLMSGGRHKKEIKRRTKTGCLTCRKRRIKCDEGHPTCRNCQKSKRDCLGYDPIFKPQPGPPSIQNTTQTSYSPMAQPPPSSYPPPPTQTYSPSAYGAPIIDGDPPSTQPLEKVDSSSGHEQGADSNGTANETPIEMKVKIEDLLCIGGVAPPPPAPSSSLSEETKGEIKKIYTMAYAIGMDKFFETRWFSDRGLDQLLANSVLCDQFAMLTHRFAMNPQDPMYTTQLQITQSLEAMVVWSMLGMSRKIARTKDETGKVNDDDVRVGVLDAAKRIEIFQALISGEYKLNDEESDDSESRANGTGVQGQLESRGHKFWHHVHRFLAIRPESPEAVQEIESNLTACRTLLDSMENRDVIYSIMVARYYGPKVSGFPERMRPPETNDEKDIDAKLAVAKRLLEDEAAGRGTNQVVQRLCGVAVRSWYVKP